MLIISVVLDGVCSCDDGGIWLKFGKLCSMSEVLTRVGLSWLRLIVVVMVLSFFFESIESWCMFWIVVLCGCWDRIWL